MKILFFTHYGELYGANRSLLDLFDNQKIFIPIVICPKNGDFYLEIQKRNIKCYAFKIFPLFGLKTKISFLVVLVKIINNVIALFLLVIIARWNNIDIIYSNSSVITIGVILAKILNRPHIWHIRELFDIHYDLKFYFGQKTFKYLLNQSNILISISHYVENIVLKDIIVPKFVIYNGTIFPQKFNKKIHVANYSIGNFSFGVVGKIYPQKNLHIVLQAFNRFNLLFPMSKLIFIGEVHDKVYFQDLKRMITNENVTFSGHISDINDIYKKMDFLIMSSQYEAMGRVIIEAMSFGIPVVGNKSGAIPEIINDKKDGLIYEGTIDDLYSKMITIASDYELYNYLRLNGLLKVEKNFTVNSYSTKIAEIIRKLYEGNIS